jgi:hypothetical protein
MDRSRSSVDILWFWRAMLLFFVLLTAVSYQKYNETSG